MNAVCRLSGVVFLGLALSGCQPPEEPPPPPGPADVVGGFFSAYPGDFRQADRAALSAALSAAIASVVAIEEASAAAVAASGIPSDQPLAVEGELFSGFFQGFDGFAVGDQEVGEGKATVSVVFTNSSHYGAVWTDRVELVDEDGWKIDDVRYLDKRTGALGMREVLRDFKEIAAQDPLLSSSEP